MSSRFRGVVGRMLLVLLVPLSIGQGCQPATSSQIQSLSPAEAKTLIDDHEGDTCFVIIDVCTAREFANGHIEGAINLSILSATFNDALATLDKARTYLVYCSTNHRSPLACQRMQEAGFTHIYNMTGGLTQWTSEGLPVVQ